MHCLRSGKFSIVFEKNTIYSCPLKAFIVNLFYIVVVVVKRNLSVINYTYANRKLPYASPSCDHLSADTYSAHVQEPLDRLLVMLLLDFLHHSFQAIVC